MNYYNWKTGHWETYDQCRKSSIVAPNPLTLYKKPHLEEIEEVPKKENRIKRLFMAYKQFENKLYGNMLGKGYHLVAAGLVRWLLKTSIVTVFCGLLYTMVMLVFKIPILSIIIHVVFNGALAFGLYVFVVALTSSGKQSNSLSAKRAKKEYGHDKKKPSSWAFLVEHLKKEEARRKKREREIEQLREAAERNEEQARIMRRSWH